ncbi:Kinesin-like protein KIF24 [Collichthys lucidus]|uniref:Kinesin-like protein KIF24 n=1 Tax=Collichthys lucidus TaxID=240159 RepID=A0A4U5UVB7_COLLU|nr:Kinesin-like protein KIF24 [Collichthys lucidus]
MERLKALCLPLPRTKEEKEKRGEREEEEMALCLYECLRAVGLQRHYARFTSVGVCRVAHLSGLTMEDYHNLGISSMEDRTRTLPSGYAIADGSISYDGCGEPDEDEYDDVDEKSDAVSSFSKPSNVCRRLDFSCESSDHHQKPLPVGTVHAYASHNINNESGQSKGSAISVQLELDTESPVVCSCKGNNNHRSDVRSHQSNHRTGANSKPDIVEGLSISNFHTRLSPNHSPKLRPVAAASNSFSNKLNGYKDRKGISRKEKLYAGISRNTASEHTAKATPVYESKRTAGYNYGLPLSSPPSPNKRQPDGQRISVCVRKRPLTHAECRRGESDVVTTLSGECVTVHESKEAVDLTQYILQHRFYFDHVFGEESSNEEVYRKTAYPLVQHMLNGLFAREDGQKVVHIAGLRHVRVDSVISQGTEERTQGMSGVNPLSSRSHALLQIQLRGPNQQIAGSVKELRGQGGLRGGRRGKTIPSPKRNLSNGNTSRGGSGVATRGKSPPKKPKLWRQKKAFSPASPTSRLATEGAVLCSTPKKDRWGEETGAIARNGFGLEQITPIKGFLGTGDKRERSDGRIGRRREKYGGTESEGDHRATRPGEQLHLWEVPRQSGFYYRERESQQSTGGKVDERAIGGLEVERRWIEQRRQVESSADTCNDAERLRERDLQKVESDNERASLSPSSSSSLQHTSRISVSALMCHGLEDVLDAYGVARVEVRTDGYRGQSSSSSSGEVCSQTGTSPRYNKNNDEVDHGDSGGVSEDWREGTEAGFGHNRATITATACLTTLPVDPTHQRAPAERPLSPPCEHTNTLLTHNELSEHTRRTSNFLPLPLRNVQQGVPSSSRKEKGPWFSTNRREYFNSQSATLPPRTPIAQNECKIPAEPLNLSDNPAHTHNHPQVKAKTSVFAQGETSTDSLSYIMDPLSISLLDVDQQVATASFLQGEQNNISLCLLEYEEDKRRDTEKEPLTCAKMANRNVGNKDEEFRLSLLELPQAKTHSPMSETVAATNSEPRKDIVSCHL